MTVPITEKAVEKNAFRPSVLVVDDEQRIRDGCCKVLEKEGIDVLTADCGELGLKMIEAQHFDIILLDLMMPGLSGFDVLTHVKAIHPESVIIVITGYATIEHSIEAMKKGAFDFIPKPFSLDQLRLIVAKAIEHTQTLQDIAVEKSRMRQLVNHLGDGVMATDSEKRVVLSNPAFLKMVGYREESPVGRPVGEVVRNEVIEDLVGRALATGSDDFVELMEELECPPAEGAGSEGVTLGVRCVPFRDRARRNVGTITVLHDITALKRVDRIRSDFVSMVAHEIRNPLSAVAAQLKVVLDGLAGEVTEKQREILTRAKERLGGLSDLTSELLDLSRIESGLISQEKEHLDMAELLERQVEFQRPRAEAGSLVLEWVPPPAKLRPVLGNRRNIEEVLSNLIGNAVNYTPQGGRISVSAAMEHDYVRVSVSDTGFGIPAEDLDRIFLPFYRVKNEKTRFIIGTGLGLAIVKKIVEAHHGFIRVESEVGRGSSFHVHLPAAD